MVTSNVKGYTDAQILERVSTAKGFNPAIGEGGYPSNYWLVGIRSTEDAFNTNDDKFYLFKGQRFIGVWKGTTNAGTDMLRPTNPKGEAVLETDNIWYDSHKYAMHRGKVWAYVQAIPLPIHRDNDRDKLTEESGPAVWENVGINIHPESYIKGSEIERELINEWSQGCQTFARRSHFDEFMRVTNGQQRLTYCLLKEW